MDDTVLSFTYRSVDARRVFKGIGARDLILAVLAGIAPREGWEGCLVYRGEQPPGEEGLVCVGVRGPAAAEVQRRLVEAFEGHGIPVLEIFEGGPAVAEELARASADRWQAAR